MAKGRICLAKKRKKRKKKKKKKKKGQHEELLWDGVYTLRAPV